MITRRIVYTHCLVAAPAVLMFYRSATAGWHPPDWFFSSPVGALYGVWMLSAFVFPAALAEDMVGRLPWWRWLPLLLMDLVLALLQYVALGLLVPFRA